MTQLKRTAAALVLALLVAGIARSQEKPDETVSASEAEVLYQSLEEELQADMERMFAAERDKMAAWEAAAAKAKADGTPVPAAPAMRMAPSPELIAKHFGLHEKAAAKFAATDDAIRFLAMAVSIGSMMEEKARVAAACETLVTAHIKSEGLADALPAISMVSERIGAKEVDKLLRTVESGSPHPDVRARAILCRVDDDLRSAPVESTEYAAAKREALRASELAKSAAIKREVQSAINGREKMALGQVAPDIAGVDLDGVAFKLSDYQGKVVMLDFWGNW